jgi:hypothetical protein
VQEKTQTTNSTVPTRQSTRITKDHTPICEKAVKRVKELNNISDNTFALFNYVDNNYLYNLAIDFKIGLGDNMEKIDQQLDAFRAQELAQVAIDRLEHVNR